METTDYCSYELSKQLKSAGFDEPCDHYYCAFDNETDVRFWSIHSAQSQNGFTNLDDKVIADAPTLAHAQKWLRKKKKLFIEVSPNFGMRARATFGITSHDFTLFDSRGHIINDMDRSTYSSYECALSAGIAAALELIKKRRII